MIYRFIDKIYTFLKIIEVLTQIVLKKEKINEICFHFLLRAVLFACHELNRLNAT